MLVNFAMAQELAGVTRRPARHATRGKINRDACHASTEDEVVKFLKARGLRTKARLALLLGLDTGMAR